MSRAAAVEDALEIGGELDGVHILKEGGMSERGVLRGKQRRGPQVGCRGHRSDQISKPNRSDQITKPNSGN